MAKTACFESSLIFMYTDICEIVHPKVSTSWIAGNIS